MFEDLFIDRGAIAPLSRRAAAERAAELPVLSQRISRMNGKGL